MGIAEQLRHRRHSSRATAEVLAVENARLGFRCRVLVQPPDGAPFESILLTRAPIVAPALTYVLFNPGSPARCVLDTSRLRANGVRDGRGYHSSSMRVTATRTVRETSTPRRFGLEDARERLQLLDQLNLQRVNGTLTEAEFRAQKTAILKDAAAVRGLIGLVLSGGGARGAYEAGVLSALAPSFTPDVVVGTSIGALNGAFLASRADEPFPDAVEALVDTWRALRWEDVLGPLLSVTELRRGLGAALMFAGLPGPGLPGLIDTRPLHGAIERLIDFERLTRNVEAGALRAVAVGATAFGSGESVLFHQGGGAVARDAVRDIAYTPVTLAAEHVAASSAIPGAFPAVEIDGHWYSDGGLRLNTPLKPALALGAERVVVIGLNSTVPGASDGGRPDAIDGLAQLVQVALADQVAADVATLAGVNEREPSRRITYVFVAPEDDLVVGRLAHDIFKRSYSGARGLVRDANVALLGRAVGADRSAVHGEVLSYLFVAREFVDGLIGLGRADGERWLAAAHDDGIWQISR